MQARSYDMEITLSKATHDKFAQYLQRLQNSNTSGFKAGQRLTYVLQHSDLSRLTTHDLIDAFMKTLKPCVFAEAPDQVRGDGSDWTNEEIQLMGQLIPMRTVTPYFRTTYLATFNDAVSDLPPARMLFTHGALLNNTQTDLSRVVFNNQVSDSLYLAFMEDNFLPGFIQANAESEPGKSSIITLPVLGGRAFAGPYAEQINNKFFTVLFNMLDKHKDKLPNIKHVVLTGHKQDSSFPIGNSSITLTTTTQAAGFYPYNITRTTPQNSKVFVCVAADHVSFPGNDGWGNQTTTHEGGTCMKARGLFDGITNNAQNSNFFAVQTAVGKDIYANDIGLFPLQQTNDNPPRNYTWQEIFVGQQQFVSARYLYVNGQHPQELRHNPAYNPQHLDLLAPAFYLANQPLTFSCFDKKAAPAPVMPVQVQQTAAHKAPSARKIGGQGTEQKGHGWLKNTLSHIPDQPDQVSKKMEAVKKQLTTLPAPVQMEYLSLFYDAVAQKHPKLTDVLASLRTDFCKLACANPKDEKVQLIVAKCASEKEGIINKQHETAGYVGSFFGRTTGTRTTLSEHFKFAPISRTSKALVFAIRENAKVDKQTPFNFVHESDNNFVFYFSNPSEANYFQNISTFQPEPFANGFVVTCSKDKYFNSYIELVVKNKESSLHKMEPEKKKQTLEELKTTIQGCKYENDKTKSGHVFYIDKQIQGIDKQAQKGPSK